MVFGSGIGVTDHDRPWRRCRRWCSPSWTPSPEASAMRSLVRMLGDLNTIFFSVTSVMTMLFLGSPSGWAMVRDELAAPRGSGGSSLDRCRPSGNRGLDRRHLQQLPRQGMARDRVGRLRRLSRRHAGPERARCSGTVRKRRRRRPQSPCPDRVAPPRTAVPRRCPVSPAIPPVPARYPRRHGG